MSNYKLKLVDDTYKIIVTSNVTKLGQTTYSGVGPRGLPGADGTDGIQGPAGPTGPAGPGVDQSNVSITGGTISGVTFLNSNDINAGYF